MGTGKIRGQWVVDVGECRLVTHRFEPFYLSLHAFDSVMLLYTKMLEVCCEAPPTRRKLVQSHT